MKSLILDTSNQYLVVAIYEDDTLLAAISEEGGKRQSENAIPYIAKLLDQHHLEMFDFDEIVVTCGPGSYTGERVGLTIAKTVKTVHEQTAVKMISSLAAYAGINGKKVSVIDARSKKVFVGVYNHGCEVIGEKMIEIADFADFMKGYPDYEVVGQTEIVGLAHQEISIYENMHELAKAKEAVESVHALLPRYIKDVEAKKIWHP